MRQRVGFKANLTRREDIIKPGNIRFFKASLSTALDTDCDSKSLFIFKISSPKQNPRAQSSNLQSKHNSNDVII